LRLLSETAQGGVVHALAREGGIQSSLWAGPENISREMRNGSVAVQGGPRKKPVRLRLGFTSEDFGYAISLGLPPPGDSFSLDPQIKRECIWAGEILRPASLLVDRDGPLIRVRGDEGWQHVFQGAHPFDSMFSEIADPRAAPEAHFMRETIRGWRFYDHFRTDHEAPARIPQIGTRTMALHNDGHDLAAVLETIRRVGDFAGLAEAISDAFPGGELAIDFMDGGRFGILFNQHGLLRPLTGTELSDGTLRYLLWVAALLTPRPPSLMVLNEPETSLHPDLLPALARLIIRAAESSQIWVVSHAKSLIAALQEDPDCRTLELEKELGVTQIRGQGILDAPAWNWAD
jgi:predicted ATPase